MKPAKQQQPLARLKQGKQMLWLVSQHGEFYATPQTHAHAGSGTCNLQLEVFDENLYFSILFTGIKRVILALHCTTEDQVWPLKCKFSEEILHNIDQGAARLTSSLETISAFFHDTSVLLQKLVLLSQVFIE